MYSVKRTVELGLCISCEICNASCPVNAIEMEYKGGQFFPKIKDECTNCQLCLRVCPGIDVEKINFESSRKFGEKITGTYLESYSAYTKNIEILKNSTSGGLITTLIIHLLKSKQVDGAFVLPFETFSGQPARLLCAKNESDVRDATKSKYIPASVYNIIKIMQKNSKPNYVIVGTPCQIKGIKKYIKEKNVDDNKILFFGLFCEKSLNFNIIRYFEDKYSRNEEKLVKFDFRNKEKDGWPGHPKLYFDSDRELIIDRSERLKVKNYFQLERCLYCLDKLNKLSDISFGDCYIYGKEVPGRSSLIVRTEKGKSVLEKYSHLFNIENSSIISIKISQGLFNKKENLDFINCFLKNTKKTKRKTRKNLRKRKKKINLGRNNYNSSKLKRAILFHDLRHNLSTILRYLQKAIKMATIIGIYFLSEAISLRKRETSNFSQKENFIIIGGGLSNKGAQAMTFTVVDQIKEKFPNRDIYLFSNAAFKRDEYEKSQYNFKIMPWSYSPYDEIKLNLLSPLRNKYRNKIENDLKNIIQNTTCFIDISGYILTSSFNIGSSLDYLFNIMIAKKFSVPYYIFPQSIGPFDYPLLSKIIINIMFYLYLKYPEKIYVREKQGLKDIRRFTKNNIELRRDIVLTSKGYNINHIFKGKENFKSEKMALNSVGIIPNEKVINRMDSKTFFSIYKLIIKVLINSGKKVYILKHSKEDVHICLKLKDLFKNDKNVKIILDDLNCIELEKIISQFDFIVASRYHSIIHAYRNNIPALVIGWADKYNELLTGFSQEQYFNDVRCCIDEKKILTNLKILINKHPLEKKVIEAKMRHNEKSCFDEILHSQ